MRKIKLFSLAHLDFFVCTHETSSKTAILSMLGKKHEGNVTDVILSFCTAQYTR